MFGSRFEFLLYDITSTYFEGQCTRSNPQAQRGYSHTMVRFLSLVMWRCFETQMKARGLSNWRTATGNQGDWSLLSAGLAPLSISPASSPSVPQAIL